MSCQILAVNFGSNPEIEQITICSNSAEKELNKFILEKAAAIKIALPLAQIEICGLWIWISNTEKANAEILKSFNCLWAPKKKIWYYAGKKCFSNGKATIPEIRAKYGSSSI